MSLNSGKVDSASLGRRLRRMPASCKFDKVNSSWLTVQARHGKSASKSPRQPRAQAASIEQSLRPGRARSRATSYLPRSSGLANVLRRSSTPVYGRRFGLSQVEWRIVALAGEHAPDLAQRTGGTHGPGQGPDLARRERAGRGAAGPAANTGARAAASASRSPSAVTQLYDELMIFGARAQLTSCSTA